MTEPTIKNSVEYYTGDVIITIILPKLWLVTRPDPKMEALHLLAKSFGYKIEVTPL